MEVDEDLTQHRRRGLELLPASILSRQPNADHRESSPAMRSIATFPASPATAGHRIELPLPLATTAGQKGEQCSSAAETEKVKTALIESSHSRAPPYRLPPRKHGGDTEPPPPSAAPQHQDGRARKDWEDGLIFGDLSPQLHLLQQLPPPELHSDKYQDEHAHQIRSMGASALLQDATMGQVSHLLYSLTTPASVLSHLQPATSAGKASGRPGKKIRTTLKDRGERKERGE